MPERRASQLLAAFQTFFREYSEHWLGRFDYAEAGQQLILQAFLQRIVNSAGRVEREYEPGRGRSDLLILWPWRGREAPEPAVDKFVIECKVLHKSLEQSISSRNFPFRFCLPYFSKMERRLSKCNSRDV